MNLFNILGKAYLLQSRYHCKEAEAIYKGNLTSKQRETGWVMAQIARCLFEQSKYYEATRVYEKIRKIEPYRLEGLEYYSTCLWHLKDQISLNYLSNCVLEKSLNAPETWCVVGNSYSLMKEHETALKFFSRSIQIQPNFAYAHTLCGHEYVANEDFDNGKRCYQTAIKYDQSHYNAWWGLGNIAHK